jgi:MarR family transcriptional regulator, organic hydroperoxide resistance regulator
MRTKARARSPIYEAWGLIQELMMDVQKPRFAALCAELDITPPQFFTLRRLEPDRPIPMSELARMLACDASNITGIVDRLEARGLVERQSAPGDRRVKMLALTGEGAAFREELSERMAEPPAALAELSPEDQTVLRDIMRRAVAGYSS